MTKYKTILRLFALISCLIALWNIKTHTRINSRIFKQNIHIKSVQFYKIEQYGSLNSSEVTVMSVYYHLNKSKHSHASYLNWQKNFLSSVSSPLVIFTDKNSIEELIMLRKYPTTLYITDSIWTVLEQVGRERHKDYVSNYKNVQHSLDREKHIHNPNLYAIWNLKSYITKKISEDNIYNSSTFIYTDAGAWRQGQISEWPDQEFVLQVKQKLGDKLLLSQVKDEALLLSNKKFPDLDLIQGGFFMGTRQALANYYSEFWDIHDARLNRGEFGGKEQVLMNIYAFNSSQTSVKLKIWKRNCSSYSDVWFFYQYYFAKQEAYRCFGPKQSLLSNFS